MSCSIVSALVSKIVCTRRALGVELSIERFSPVPPTGPVIFALLNQTSLIESTVIPSIIAPRAFHTFANWEYVLLPLVGQWCWFTGCFVVCRGWYDGIAQSFTGSP